MDSAGLTQKELAAKLGIDPTTLNNFLNRENKALGGLAVALACTVGFILAALAIAIVDLRITRGRRLAEAATEHVSTV